MLQSATKDKYLPCQHSTKRLISSFRSRHWLSKTSISSAPFYGRNCPFCPLDKTRKMERTSCSKNALSAQVFFPAAVALSPRVTISGGEKDEEDRKALLWRSKTETLCPRLVRHKMATNSLWLGVAIHAFTTGFILKNAHACGDVPRLPCSSRARVRNQ